jgi:hypothetical protein
LFDVYFNGRIRPRARAASRDACRNVARRASEANGQARRVEEGGNAAMGFDQDATTHHFLITDDGGVIQVTGNDARDTANCDAIRAHLEKSAQDFSAGVFDSPLATHGEVPPGVPVLQQRKGSITYRYEAIDGGARVRIVASDPQAVAAVKEFLRYQIREHKTGDPGVR